MAGASAAATGISVVLTPSSVFTGQTSQASVTVSPSAAKLDAPASVLWGVIDAGATLSLNGDGTATVQALTIAGSFRIEAQATSNFQAFVGVGTLTVLQGFTGLQLTNSAPQNPLTGSRQIPIGGSFTLTPVFIPPGCTAPVDANSWTVAASAPGNAVSINQATGVVTVTGNVLGAWQAVVSFTSNGQTISASAFWSAVNVIAAATGIQISVNLPDGITIGPATIQLVQGRVGTLSAAALPAGVSALDAAPNWTTSNSTIVNFGGPATATGYSVPFNVVGSTGTATITCTGTSGGVQVQATLAITALAVATSVLVSVAPNNTPVVGSVVTATAILVPGGSSIIGKPQWSLSTNPGSANPGAANLVMNADGTATVTSTAPGVIVVTASATTPTGTITGTATLTIGVAISDILVVVAPPMFLGKPAPGFPTLVVGASSYFLIGQSGGSLTGVATAIPTTAQIDSGSWRVSVVDGTVATASIDPNTGVLTITALVDSGRTGILVSASSGNGLVTHTTAFLLWVGAGPCRIVPLIAPILTPSCPGFTLWFQGAGQSVALTAKITQAATAEGVVLTQQELQNALMILEMEGGLPAATQADINGTVALVLRQRAGSLATQGMIDQAIVDLQGNQLFKLPPPDPPLPFP